MPEPRPVTDLPVARPGVEGRAASSQISRARFARWPRWVSRPFGKGGRGPAVEPESRRARIVARAAAMFHPVLQHIEKCRASLAWIPQLMGLIAVRENQPAMSQRPVRGMNHPNRKRLHATRKGHLVIGLDNQVQVVRLDGEVHDAKAGSFSLPRSSGKQADHHAGWEGPRGRASLHGLGGGINVVRVGGVAFPLSGPTVCGQRRVWRRHGEASP